MDDRMTAYDVPTMVASGIDFAKTLVRVDLADSGTVATLAAMAQVVTQSAAAGLPIMLEPFISRRVEGRVSTTSRRMPSSCRSPSRPGLGASSAYTWMKLPVVDEMERVMDATTMPTLLFGGDSGDDPDETFASWGDALALPGVRGLIVGRTLLYPDDDDVAAAVDIAVSMVRPEGVPA